MPGRHNVQNALAAVAVAVEMGVSDDLIRTGFRQVRRGQAPLYPVGEVDGTAIIDDYGHHPVEIRAFWPPRAKACRAA
jgi:UDP-N-acetylmuramate--alanine ligase